MHVLSIPMPVPVGCSPCSDVLLMFGCTVLTFTDISPNYADVCWAGGEGTDAGAIHRSGACTGHPLPHRHTPHLRRPAQQKGDLGEHEQACGCGRQKCTGGRAWPLSLVGCYRYFVFTSYVLPSVCQRLLSLVYSSDSAAFFMLPKFSYFLLYSEEK